MSNKLIIWITSISIMGILFSIFTLIANLIRNLFIPRDQSPIARIIQSTGEYNGLILVISIVLLYMLTRAVLSDISTRVWENMHMEDLWKRILQTVPVIGLIAYEIVVVERADFSSKYKLVKKRLFVKTVYAIAMIGTLCGFIIMIAIVALIRDPEFMKLTIAIEIFIMYAAAFATMLLYLCALLDAANRSQEEWQRVDFLSIINPWSWVFGLRQYYLKYLLPSSL